MLFLKFWLSRISPKFILHNPCTFVPKQKRYIYIYIYLYSRVPKQVSLVIVGTLQQNLHFLPPEFLNEVDEISGQSNLRNYELTRGPSKRFQVLNLLFQGGKLPFFRCRKSRSFFFGNLKDVISSHSQKGFMVSRLKLTTVCQGSFWCSNFAKLQRKTKAPSAS